MPTLHIFVHIAPECSGTPSPLADSLTWRRRDNQKTWLDPSRVAATTATRYTSCMSSKDKILSVIRTLPDDVSVEEAIDRLYLLSKIERGIREADVGNVVDYDAVMNELLDDET